MDSYAIQKNSETSFTVIITSPHSLTWRPLDSDGISIVENDCTINENGRNYIWTVEVEKPGTYEFKILHQSGDGVYKKLVIPLICKRDPLKYFFSHTDRYVCRRIR